MTFSRRSVCAAILALLLPPSAIARERELTCEEDEDFRDEREDCMDGADSSGSDGTGWENQDEDDEAPSRRRRKSKHRATKRWLSNA